MDTPDLRIVSDAQWDAAHVRLSESRSAYLRYTNGRLLGRPERGVESKYVLPLGLHVRTRNRGRQRVHFYGCSAYWNRGTPVCANNVEVSTPATDEAVDLFENEVLSPEVVALAASGTEVAAVLDGVRTREGQRTTLRATMAAMARREDTSPAMREAALLSRLGTAQAPDSAGATRRATALQAGQRWGSSSKGRWLLQFQLARRDSNPR